MTRRTMVINFLKMMKPLEDLQLSKPDKACCGALPKSFTSAETVEPAARLEQAFVKGSVDTPAGPVPRISHVLDLADRLGTIKARWGIRRMHYRVDPGLYALGEPDHKSPVLVTANYKMTFDSLRSSVENLDAWILALDTNGINVWCAAGKGTFGTAELVGRVESSRLREVVSHKTLVVPQLGAPGVAAHLVLAQSKFRVVFGPVRAGDLRAFLGNGYKATPKMRAKTFTFGERAVLVPVELMAALKWTVLISIAAFPLSGLGWPGEIWPNMVSHGTLAVVALFGGLLAGAVVTPLLLPWLPGRAFSVKGFEAGLLVAGLILAVFLPTWASWPAWLELSGWMAISLTLASFLALNFTGSSTYTSLSGVRKEIRRAAPVQIAFAILGLATVVASRFLA